VCVFLTVTLRKKIMDKTPYKIIETSKLWSPAAHYSSYSNYLAFWYSCLSILIFKYNFYIMCYQGFFFFIFLSFNNYCLFTEPIFYGMYAKHSVWLSLFLITLYGLQTWSILVAVFWVCRNIWCGYSLCNERMWP
jgi:hypothetical protein